MEKFFHVGSSEKHWMFQDAVAVIRNFEANATYSGREFSAKQEGVTMSRDMKKESCQFFSLIGSIH